MKKPTASALTEERKINKKHQHNKSNNPTLYHKIPGVDLTSRK